MMITGRTHPDQISSRGKGIKMKQKREGAQGGFYCGGRVDHVRRRTIRPADKRRYPSRASPCGVVDKSPLLYQSTC